jgi:hypothetical protein
MGAHRKGAVRAARAAGGAPAWDRYFDTLRALALEPVAPPAAVSPSSALGEVLQQWARDPRFPEQAAA